MGLQAICLGDVVLRYFDSGQYPGSVNKSDTGIRFIDADGEGSFTRNIQSDHHDSRDGRTSVSQDMQYPDTYVEETEQDKDYPVIFGYWELLNEKEDEV